MAKQASQNGTLDLSGTPYAQLIFLEDIRIDVMQFYAQIEVLDLSGAQCPAVVVAEDETAPINIIRSLSGSLQFANNATLRNVQPSNLPSIIDEAKNNVASASFRLVALSTLDAKRLFQSGLEAFLIHRAEAAEGLYGSLTGASSGSPGVPGLNISVASRSHGLHILYAPAFFPNVTTTLSGSVSSPVNGYINPGLYVFGASGPTLPLTFETWLKHPIPPSTSITMATV